MLFVILLGILLIQSGSSLDFTNPIIDKNCPDPGVLLYKGVYYVSTTSDSNADENKFPIHSSRDLVNWKFETYIWTASHKPVWAVQDFWAPEIHLINKKFVVYYVARHTSGMLAIGAATSQNVTGPFTDLGKPLLLDSSVGMIDPTYHYNPDEGQGYLIWKEDGNGKVPPETYTPIWSQKLRGDGLAFVGQRVEILKNDPNSWEGPLVEAPWVIHLPPYFYLFYSANSYASDLYAVGVARSKTIQGEYEKSPDNPIMHSNHYFSGPGHCSVVSTGKSRDWVMIYHAWLYGHVNPGVDPRVLMMDLVIWENDWPRFNHSSPSAGPVPLPPSGPTLNWV